MTLPDNFSPWEHLQSTLKYVHNRMVREEFRDLGENWNPEINTPRGSLRVASELRDDDTSSMVLLRLFLFYFVLRKAQDLFPPMYGIPTNFLQGQRHFRPQIMLFFMQDVEDVDYGISPVFGEISVRLMHEDNNTLTQSKIATYASRIKTAFGSGNGLVWRKGKTMCSYTNHSKGYQLQLLCRSESEARQLIGQVLSIKQDTLQNKYFNVKENQDPNSAYPNVPEREVILGESRRLPRRRPVADVRFQYALLHVWGLAKPIPLVDRTGKFLNPLERAS